VAVNVRLGGLAPIAGGTGAATESDGDVINCANPGISAANLFIDRPPTFPFPDFEELPIPAAARGVVPVDVASAATGPVAVACDGTTLMVARGTAAPRLLVSEEGSLG